MSDKRKWIGVVIIPRNRHRRGWGFANVDPDPRVDDLLPSLLTVFDQLGIVKDDIELRERERIARLRDR